MADLIPMLAAVAGQAGEEADEDFNQTVLLLHGDGTNGAQNNTFLDGSTNNFTITRNGNTTQGTFSPFSGPNGYWSNYFDGNDSDLTLSSAVTLTSDYTLEVWVYKPNSGVKEMILGNTVSNNQFSINAANKVEIYNGTTYESTGTITINQWTHVAVSRSGSTLRFFINGQLSGTHTDSSNISFNNIGELLGSLARFVGYLSNVRIVSSAVYTSAFTPSTTPLTAITNTQLLTCQSNRFVDNSASPKTFTISGAVRVTPFSPFAPSAAYSASTNGGSGYFDGTGDYLSIADNAALQLTADFTMECWVYIFPTAENQVFISKWNNSSQGYLLFYTQSTSKITFQNTATSFSSSSTIPLNQWTHVAVTRSGNDYTLYIDGVSAGTASSGGAATDSGTAVNIGRNVQNSANLVLGYISNLRIIKGSAVAPPAGGPTSPVTAITNTSLLCNFTNAGIFDNTGKNNLETVGNAQIDTTTKKYGTGSMEFDGTGDYCSIPHDVNFEFGNGNFTIEMWLYFSSYSDAKCVLTKGWGSGAYAPFLIYTETNKISFYSTATDGTWSITPTGLVIINSAPSTGVWYHIAIVRNGNTFATYLNGVQTATTTSSASLLTNTSPLRIGADNAGTSAINGYIDDLRITKGVARYTANFTAPTKAFPDQ